MGSNSTKAVKVVVLGASQSGKTALIERLESDLFYDIRDFKAATLTSLPKENDGVSMSFLDGESQTTRSLRAESNLLRAQVAVIAVDLSSADCLKDWQDAYKNIQIQKNTVKIVVAFTKSDLVSKEDKDKRIAEIKLYLPNAGITEDRCIETSAKNNMNINKIKDCINKAVLELSPITNTYKHLAEGRTHLFKAVLNSTKNGRCGFLDEEEKKLTGDALKGKILDKFRNELEDSIGPKSFKAAVKKIEESAEYEIIKTSQGLASKVFGFETDSHKSLREMISEREMQLNIASDDNDRVLSPGSK